MNNNTSASNTNYPAPLTMPADLLLRHKLSNKPSAVGKVVCKHNSAKVRKFARMISGYRLRVHGVTEKKLAAPLRNMCHYFSIPMSREDSDNYRDRRGLETTTETNTTKQ